MGRPADWTPLGLDGDPVPGDPAEVTREAAHLATVAAEITREIAALTRIAQDSAGAALEGHYAGKIRSAASTLAGDLGKVAGRYQRVSSALQRWAPDLEHAQALSLTALTEAEGPARILHTTPGFPASGPLTPAQQQDKRSWERTVSRAQADLDAAAALLAKAVSFRDERAGHCAALINSAIDDAVKDSWWQAHVLDWIDRNAGWLSTLADVLGWLATAIAVVALFIPGLNVLAAVLLGSLLLVQTALAVAGDGSWVAVGLDVLSIATLGLGSVAADGLTAAEKTAQTALRDGAAELGSRAWQETAAATRVVRSAAGRVFADEALRSTAEWSSAQDAASTAMKAMWAARRSAVSDAADLAGKEFKPGFVRSYLSGGREAAGIREFFTKAGERFPGYQPLADAIAKGMPKFNLGQRLFLGSVGTDYLNHLLGGSPVLGWKGFGWYSHALTYTAGSAW